MTSTDLMSGTDQCPMSTHYARPVIRDGQWTTEPTKTCQISHVDGSIPPIAATGPESQDDDTKEPK